MVHVTTASDVVAETPLYELEADRLVAQLAMVPVKPPLLVSTVEGNLLLKKEKMLEELSTSPRLASHKLFHETLLVFLAQLQTLSLREGQLAVRREDEILLRMQQCQHHASMMRHLSAKTVQQVNALGAAHKECEQLEREVDGMASELKDLCELALVIDAGLTGGDREAVRLAVLGETPRSRSNSGVPATEVVAAA